jgi:hypothetical protein
MQKIISGGQTGVDRAALDAAMRLGISHGGWIPKGRLTEEGPLPDVYQLEEMETTGYPERTEQNVIDSDGTLLISRGTPTGGTDYTRKMALKHGKQLLHIDLTLQPGPQEAASLITSWATVITIGSRFGITSRVSYVPALRATWPKMLMLATVATSSIGSRPGE